MCSVGLETKVTNGFLVSLQLLCFFGYLREEKTIKRLRYVHKIRKKDQIEINSSVGRVLHAALRQRPWFNYFRVKISNCLNCDSYNFDDHISISSVFPQFKLTSFCVSFLSGVKLNSINWCDPTDMWVFIGQLVDHCSANAVGIGKNPVEALKFFQATICNYYLQLLKLRSQLRSSHLHFICIPAVQINFLYVSFLSKVKMNSINWSAPNIWSS